MHSTPQLSHNCVLLRSIGLAYGYLPSLLCARFTLLFPFLLPRLLRTFIPLKFNWRRLPPQEVLRGDIEALHTRLGEVGWPLVRVKYPWAPAFKWLKSESKHLSTDYYFPKSLERFRHFLHLCNQSSPAHGRACFFCPKLVLIVSLLLH